MILHRIATTLFVLAIISSHLPALLAATTGQSKPLSIELLTDSKRILALGDSITYSGEYVSHFATWANLKHNVPASRFMNLGVPSETVSGLSEIGHAGGRFPRPDLHERLKRVLDETKPDLIFACYGINCGIYQPLDEGRLAAYQSGIARLKKAADEREIAIVFITPPTFDALRQPNKQYYEEVMHRYATWLVDHREKGWQVIDLHAAMQKQLDVERESDPNFTWQRDSVHPNADGHKAMATALIHAFAADFDSKELGSPAHEAQFTKTQSELKTIQKKLLEATKHRRPGIPGFVEE